MHFYTLLFIFLCSSSTWAEVSLFLFKPPQQSLIYVLPRLNSEPLHEAVTRYSRSLENSPELMKLFQDTRFLQSWSESQVIDVQNLPEKPNVFAIANRETDMNFFLIDKKSHRLFLFRDYVGKKNNYIVIPVAAAIGLTATGTQQFFQHLISLGDGLIPLGGHDVDPSYYQEEKTQSRETNRTRDGYEIALIQAWIQAKKGFLFAVCRGHQLTSVALGFKLKQHIDAHGDGQWSSHPIQLLKTLKNRFLNLFQKNEIAVNSYHHQAVIYENNKNIEVAAIGPEGTVEALESRDGLIMSTQFHPEFMSDRTSKSLFNLINSAIYSRYQMQCRHLFR